MRRLHFLLLAVVFGVCASQADVTLGGKSYAVDTLQRRQVGPGTVNTILRLPDYPLNVYVLEVDVTNEHNRVETTFAQNTVGKTEGLVNGAKRLTIATKRPFAGCNANFWIVSASGAPLNVYGLGTPLGGVVRNDTVYVNTNNSVDKWDGGPSRTAASAITHDKRLYMGHFLWTGSVTIDKNGAEHEILNVNRRCLTDEIALWNVAYSRTREFEDDWVAYNTKGENNADNYYLTFAPESGWVVNHDMHFVVSKIVKSADRQKLGEFDACLTVTGTAKEMMNTLEVGDALTINSSWMTNESDSEHIFPEIENYVEGNAPVMHNGELTIRNNNEEYNSQIYSRTCYGTNADGTRLYMMVIDKSTSALYGRSAGCSTETMCQLLKFLCPDVSEVVNYDAGGSAEMMVRGAIINTTTEGTPRAVACGWLIEAVGEEDNEVASIAFDAFRLQAPVYSTFSPKILGYNARGELVSEDVKGFTLSCDPSIGTCDGDEVTIGGGAGSGTLTATLGGMTCSVPIVTLEAQPMIVARPDILLDDREYPVAVTAEVAGVTYPYDPAKLVWSIEDGTVAEVSTGTLRGLRNGETRLFCEIGELRDTVGVRIEISDSPYRDIPLNEGWTVSGAGAKNFSFSDDGQTLSFTYSSNRAPNISFKNDYTFYSLPDTVALVFTCSIPVDFVQFDARNRAYNRSNYLRIDREGGFAAGVEHVVRLDLASLGGADDPATYPVTLRDIKLNLDKSQATAGEHTIAARLYAHYPTWRVEGDVNGDHIVNVTDVNLIVSDILTRTNNPAYDLTGDGTVNVSDVNRCVSIILTVGE